MENVKTVKGTDVTDEIRLRNVRFLEAYNNGDAKATASNYTKEGKILPPNSEAIQGLEGIESFWQGALDMGLKKAELETVRAESFGDTAIEEGRYKLYLENGQMADHGKLIVVWRKINDDWQMDWDIWNSSMPPA